MTIWTILVYSSPCQASYAHMYGNTLTKPRVRIRNQQDQAQQDEEGGLQHCAQKRISWNKVWVIPNKITNLSIVALGAYWWKAERGVRYS